MQEPIKIFISYSHKDEAYRETLSIHLKPLERKKIIKVWHAVTIAPGQEWDFEIKRELSEAEIILFLVSPDFLASDYVHEVELPKALERYKNQEAVVVPILIRTSRFKKSDLGRFQALPRNLKPINEWKNKDAAWMDVVEKLEGVVQRAQENRHFSPPREMRSDTSATIKYRPKKEVPKNPIETARKLLRQGKTKEALDLALEATKANDDVHNELILLAARLNSVLRESRMGIISSQNANVSKTRIMHSLLGILSDL